MALAVKSRRRRSSRIARRLRHGFARLGEGHGQGAAHLHAHASRKPHEAGPAQASSSRASSRRRLSPYLSVNLRAHSLEPPHPGRAPVSRLSCPAPRHPPGKMVRPLTAGKLRARRAGRPAGRGRDDSPAGRCSQAIAFCIHFQTGFCRLRQLRADSASVRRQLWRPRTNAKCTTFRAYGLDQRTSILCRLVTIPFSLGE